MNTTMAYAGSLTAPLLARMMREAMRDRSYELYPLGEEVAEYLRHKRKRLTDSSQVAYEGILALLAEFFLDLDLADFEPPVGTERVEEFLHRRWGDMRPQTYNRNLSICRDFFRWAVRRGKLHADPTLAIERARKRDVYRTTFTPDQRRAILAENHELRDRIALRLLLDYALRKGALRAVQFRHFDHVRKRLTVFTKGGQVRPVPIPDPAFWHDLERLILDTQAQPDWYLLPTTKGNRSTRRLVHTQPRGNHGLHDWWYRCLANAGIVPEGATRGEKMHKARHTAGQRLLDHTGNLKAVQQLLGHETISTTADTYVDWSEQQLAASLESVLASEDWREEER